MQRNSHRQWGRKAQAPSGWQAQNATTRPHRQAAVQCFVEIGTRVTTTAIA
jgi:hypothetical protein